MHRADGWDDVLKPVVARYQGKVPRIYFRADAAFAIPEVYEFLEAERIAFLVVAATSLVDHTDSALAQARPCRWREYAHNAYTVCEVDLAKHTVKLYLPHRRGPCHAAHQAHRQ